ncbi:MAG: DUF3362 domain-containing protein, partial [Bacteroidales bacterium]|nr:DUF3362 domain-containing protein [Bacteroidales bacterium]
QSDDFKGYLSDLGGPSANMSRMAGRNIEACKKCKKPSCIHPQICPNLNVDHKPLLDIYRSVDALPGIKKSFIGSGVRYDLLLYSKDASAKEYTRELIENHVSGRLKVAPEHTEDRVLSCMRKPSFEQFIQFKKIFDKIENQRLQEGKGPKGRQELVPYFISSHPACSEIDMAQLAVKTKHLNFHLEQVQDFTPTPMTLATEMYYTGYDPYTLKPVFTAKNKEDKLNQRRYFFWYKAEERAAIIRNLKKLGCQNLIRPLLG